MTTPILDEPTPPVQRRHWSRILAIGIEITFILILLFGFLLKLESWPGGSELLIIGVSGLVIVYWLLPIPLFGSRGLRQHLAAHATGFVLGIGLMGILFRIESWEPGTELLLISLPLAVILVLTTNVLWLARPDQPVKSAFYRAAALRLIPVTVILLKFVF